MKSYGVAAFAGLLMVGLSGAGLAQRPPMPTNDPEAVANVRQSEQYTALLRSSPAFRAQRMKIECGPINDPQLHASCIASFNAYTQPAK
jgi:hypothetical protein